MPTPTASTQKYAMPWATGSGKRPCLAQVDSLPTYELPLEAFGRRADPATRGLRKLTQQLVEARILPYVRPAAAWPRARVHRRGGD